MTKTELRKLAADINKQFGDGTKKGEDELYGFLQLNEGRGQSTKEYVTLIAKNWLILNKAGVAPSGSLR